MSYLSSLYPGHLVVELCVIAAGAVTLVLATAWLVSLLLQRHPPLRHCVLLSALMASLLIPAAAAAFVATGTSLVALPLLTPATAAGPGASDGRIAFGNLPPSTGRATELADNVPAAAMPAPAEVLREPASSVDHQDRFQMIEVAILLVWLGGAIVVLIGLARSTWILRRLRQSMQSVTDAGLLGSLEDARQLLEARAGTKLMTSRLARTPMAVGLFRPVILLPTNLVRGMNSSQIRDVLMHELAHIERRDNLTVWIQAIASAAFWPIPFVHLLNRELERVREELCDNHVLACRDAMCYAETLLRVAQLSCGMAAPMGSVGMLQWRGKLEERIRGLIHKRRNTMTHTHPVIAAGVLGMFLVAGVALCGTTIAEARPDEQKNSPDEKGETKVEAPAWGKVDSGLQAGVRIKDGKTRFAIGESVTLEWHIRNTGDKEYSYKEFMPAKPRDFVYPTVVDLEGKAQNVQPSYRWMTPGREKGSYETRTVAPGKVRLEGSGTFEIRAAPDKDSLRTILVSKPGKYKLSVPGGSSWDIVPSLDVTLESGQVEFEIVAPEKALAQDDTTRAPDEYELTAGFRYKDSMLVLVTSEGAAAIVFPLNTEDAEGGVTYRFRYESRDGKTKQAGTGMVSEKRKPGTDREVERNAEGGIIGEPFISAGPIKILWSPESVDAGFLYYSPEKVKVHIGHAKRFDASAEVSPFGDRREYAPLDLRRFMK